MSRTYPADLRRRRQLHLLAGLVIAAAACSCSSSKGTTPPTSTSTACTSPTLSLVFSPMYSAVIPGDETHNFQLPVIVSPPTGKPVEWKVSDPTAVSVQADPLLTEGALLTMLSTAKTPGAPVTVTATSGTECGTATLNITVATDDEWNAGEARYNDRVSTDGGARAACTDCHAPHADAGQTFNDIAHTPQQAGGFSDSQLLDIIQNGAIPDGGYFDTTIVSYKAWQAFHQWNLTPTEQVGIVVYLRSLLPTAQGGTANFGGKGATGADGGP